MWWLCGESHIRRLTDNEKKYNIDFKKVKNKERWREGLFNPRNIFDPIIIVNWIDMSLWEWILIKDCNTRSYDAGA